MGWTFQPKPTNVKAYLKKELNWDGPNGVKHRCLDLALSLTTAYAAVETTHPDGKRDVWAAVTLLKYLKDEYCNFGMKEMSEEMGPVEDNCPERILKLLTPTEHEYAKDWRARCRANLEAKKSAKALKKEGAVLVPKEGPELEIYRYGMFTHFVVASYLKNGRKRFYLRAKRGDSPGSVLFKPSAHLLNQLKVKEA